MDSVPPFSRVYGFRVVPGKHRCLCSFYQQGEFPETTVKALTKRPMTAVVITSLILCLDLLTPSIRSAVMIREPVGHVRLKLK